MATSGYQYGTSPRKTTQQVNKKNNKDKKPQLRAIKEAKRQDVKVSKTQRKRQAQLTILAGFAFLVLLAISYQNSQITVQFNKMQSQKKELALLEKENEQLKISIENNLNLSNIGKEAKEKLGMEKLTNKQTVYISLPKKDYVETASEKIIMEEEKSWTEKVADFIFHK